MRLSISQLQARNEDIANVWFDFCMLVTVCSFSLFCFSDTFFLWTLQHMVELLYCKQRLLRPHLGTEFLYSSCTAIWQLTHAEPNSTMLFYIGLKFLGILQSKISKRTYEDEKSRSALFYWGRGIAIKNCKCLSY